jgi:hypothetical protein
VPADRDRARDAAATLLTRGRGERLVHLGARPPNSALFTPASAAPPAHGADWLGARRTADELRAMHAALVQVVEELGGKVRGCGLVVEAGRRTDAGAGVGAGGELGRRPAISAPFTITAAQRVADTRGSNSGRWCADNSTIVPYVC